MPPKKKNAHTKGSVVRAPPQSPSSSTTKPGVSAGPPAPFVTPDAALKDFLDGLDVTHMYITHIDRHPRIVKRNMFIVPVILHIVIAGLLLWRIRYVAPYYGALVLTVLGRPSPTSIDTVNTPWHELINAVFNRTGTLFLDFCIFKFLAPWPLDFFVGQTSPCFWRSSIGFRDLEIVVRRSRRWDATLPEGWLDKQEDDESEGALVWKERILPAIDKQWIRAKTGYLMMDKTWDLDFLAMTVASNMVTAEKNKLQDFEKTLLVHTEEHGWLAWPVWRLDEGADDERRQKIVLFKDKLTRMGKENLFFRWIEIVQYESSQPGGFTPERQRKAMEQAKETFEAQGVDFEQFWKEVGGMEGLPGFNQ